MVVGSFHKVDSGLHRPNKNANHVSAGGRWNFQCQPCSLFPTVHFHHTQPKFHSQMCWLARGANHNERVPSMCVCFSSAVPIVPILHNGVFMLFLFPPISWSARKSLNPSLWSGVGVFGPFCGGNVPVSNPISLCFFPCSQITPLHSQPHFLPTSWAWGASLTALLAYSCQWCTICATIFAFVDSWVIAKTHPINAHVMQHCWLSLRHHWLL